MACDVGEKCCSNADSSRSHCAPESASCCGEGYCTKGKTCCNDGQGCADQGYFCCGNGLRQSCPNGSKRCLDNSRKDAPPYCAKDCVPTLRFLHIEGITDEIFENVCDGLRREYQNITSNEYTWNGRGKAGRQLKRKNRRNAGCGGSSSGVSEKLYIVIHN
ncbi:hypothetical protein BKA61DRAFT_340121 [Leptodontidium sp. MPI-SDFR-AT-0119]|nr:hypothetical protein BKA61DRAFT_340121 [Leptodontidium sp. MPI-SDFR-AT-0119]